MLDDLQYISQLVPRLASEELMDRFNRVQVEQKKDGSLVTDADAAMQARMCAELQKNWPEISILGEEMSTSEQSRLLATGEPFWCLDPLDGTTNFAAGMPIFSVSLALIENNQPVLALVYDPVRKECFTAMTGNGAWLNDVPLRVSPWTRGLPEAVAMVDFKRLSAKESTALVVDPPFRSQRNLGTSALEWAWLAAGRFQLYLHGGQKLWDRAAGSLIAREAGISARTPSGDPIFVDKLTSCPILAACDDSLWAEWQNYVNTI